MSKCDITIGRSQTINTGNFSSIKPEVSITLKDIDLKDIENKYKNLSNILDSLVALEILKLMGEQNSINELTIQGYTKGLKANIDEIEKEFKKEAKLLYG